MAETEVAGTRTASILRAACGTIAVLSAVSGILLLAIPGSTGSFFAWGLGPPPLASIAGGCFIGAAASFAYFSMRVRVAGRGLCLLGIVFAIPTLGYTLINKAVFDFGRWQAMLWLVVFIALSALFLVLPFVGGWRLSSRGPGLPAWARAILLVLMLGGVLAAVSLWIDPVGSAAWLPFVPPPLGGRFLGVWSMVVAFCCLWAAIRPAEEARPFVWAAQFLLGGAVLGAIRGSADAVGVALLPALIVLAWVRDARRRAARTPSA